MHREIQTACNCASLGVIIGRREFALEAAVVGFYSRTCGVHIDISIHFFQRAGRKLGTAFRKLGWVGRVRKRREIGMEQSLDNRVCV